MAFMAFDVNKIPDIDVMVKGQPKNPRAEFIKIKDRALSKFKDTEATAEGSFLSAGVSFLTEVRCIDWICSFKMDGSTRLQLSAIVRHLGFHILAGVLSGRSSTSPAEVKFNPDTGMLELIGARCKGGKEEFYQLSLKNPGKVKFPTYVNKHFQVHASLHEKFDTIVQEYWPALDNNSAKIAIETAKYWWAAKQAEELRKLEVVVTAKVQPLPVDPTVLSLNEALIVSKPGDQIEVSFYCPPAPNKKIGWIIVDRIKEIIPPGRRKWNGTKKVWEIRLLPTRKDEIVDLKQLFVENKFTLKELNA
jgi:hypothetical protein